MIKLITYNKNRRIRVFLLTNPLRMDGHRLGTLRNHCIFQLMLLLRSFTKKIYHQPKMPVGQFNPDVIKTAQPTLIYSTLEWCK